MQTSSSPGSDPGQVGEPRIGDIFPPNLDSRDFGAYSLETGSAQWGVSCRAKRKPI
jgi:hypothetical protein